MKKPALKIEITLTLNGNDARLESKSYIESSQEIPTHTESFFMAFKKLVADRIFLEEKLEDAAVMAMSMEQIGLTKKCDCPECQAENENKTNSSNEVTLH